MSNLPVIVSALLGFCGVIYELVFAQTLSVLFGQSAVQYSLTIGLFLAGMGIGSHWSEKWKAPQVQLWRIQFWLSLLAPLIWLGVWWLATGGWSISAFVLGYGMCVGVGILTGAELPLLFRLHARTGLILSADYFGMLAACVAFPLVLLPYFGVFTSLFLTALLNSLIAVLGTFSTPHHLGNPKVANSVRGPWVTPMYLFVPIALIAALICEPIVREWLSQRLIG
jgi:spermidine synthase